MSDTKYITIDRERLSRKQIQAIAKAERLYQPNDAEKDVAVRNTLITVREDVANPAKATVFVDITKTRTDCEGTSARYVLSKEHGMFMVSSRGKLTLLLVGDVITNPYYRARKIKHVAYMTGAHLGATAKRQSDMRKARKHKPR